MSEKCGGPDKIDANDTDDSQAFFEYCNRADFLDWLRLKRDEAITLNSDLEKPDGSGKLSRKFIIHSTGMEEGFSFSYQRLKLVPMNRRTMSPFDKVFVRLPDGVVGSSDIDCAFLSILAKDGTQENYYLDSSNFSRLRVLDSDSYEITEEANDIDYENLRIILANFEIDLQNNSPGNAA